MAPGLIAFIRRPIAYGSDSKKVEKYATTNHSSQYITDDMLAPYVQAFLPTSQIELTISCKDLLSTHTVRQKSSPYCVVSIKRPWQNKYEIIGQTETIENTHNPQFMKKINVDYNFETIQNIKFEIQDHDLKKSDFLGRWETTLSELVARYGCQSIGKLISKVEGVGYRDSAGEIAVVAEEVTTSKQIAEIEFSAENLPKSWIRNNDPFLVISRSNEDRSHSIVTKTETARSAKKTTWKPIKIRVTTLCNGDFDRSFKIDCYNHRDHGGHKLIGTCYASLMNLISLNKNVESRILVNEEKQKNKPSYVPSCVLKVEKIEITEEITFLDYIRNGTQMHFAVAIDFTASNGVYTDPKSLHHLSEDQLNCYETALRGIGNIIQQYDSSHRFPAFGFGAKLPPSGQVSFQFPLNGNPLHPYCSHVEEIIGHYREQLKVVQLYGPTNFAPVLNYTIALAKEYQDGKHYFVLLIITDGVISDMLLTKRAIIEASALPISIIIVGVGDDNFEAMNELDSDNVRLGDGNRFAERDIVQFVPLNNFLSKDGHNIKSQADLAEEVLAEIPEQLTSYMKSSGYKPIIAPTPPLDSSAIVPTAPLVSDSLDEI